MEGVIEAFLFQQFLVGPDLLDLAVLQHQNTVGFLNGLQTVGNQNRGATFRELAQRVRNQQFCFRVYAGGGLVENQYLRVRGQYTCKAAS